MLLVSVMIIVSWNRTRIPAKHVYYYRCPDHRKNYVMSFSFCFDREDDVYQFAYCYPYSYTRLQNYLDNLEKKGMDFFHRELLCLTVVSAFGVDPKSPIFRSTECKIYYLWVEVPGWGQVDCTYMLKMQCILEKLYSWIWCRQTVFMIKLSPF